MIIVDMPIILKSYIGFLRRSRFKGVLGNKKLVLGKMGNLVYRSQNTEFRKALNCFNAEKGMYFSEQPIPLDYRMVCSRRAWFWQDTSESSRHPTR